MKLFTNRSTDSWREDANKSGEKGTRCIPRNQKPEHTAELMVAGLLAYDLHHVTRDNATHRNGENEIYSDHETEDAIVRFGQTPRNGVALHCYLK